ncbi:unnamed protein product [Bursaphelenchus xylophilus]|nr:unnamed protein product [Bursaphelenchus xylophilus]CAG9082260.1 unnamed protein product [Bursaphelenchus xylophilus]
MFERILLLSLFIGLVYGAPTKSPEHDYSKYLDTVSPDHREAVGTALKCLDKMVLHVADVDDIEQIETNSSIFTFFLPFMMFDLPEYPAHECLEASDDEYLVAVRNLAERLAEPFRPFFKRRPKREAKKLNMNPFQSIRDQCGSLPDYYVPCEPKFSEDFNIRYSDTLAASSYIADVIAPGSACRLGLDGRLDKRIFKKGNSREKFQVTQGCVSNSTSFDEFNAAFAQST